MNSTIQLKQTTSTLSLIALVLACFAFVTHMQAVSPPPDGGYPGGNTAEGQKALLSRTTGGFNTALGWFSLKSLTTGSYNTGVGAGTLVLNTGDSNTAVGTGALLLNTTGSLNVAVGTNALVFNDSGTLNNAVGALALYHNIDGFSNNAFGVAALSSNITASGNTAVGSNALQNNDSTGNGVANGNTAVGFSALNHNIDGSANTAVGEEALSLNDIGFQNTAVGSGALLNNTTGGANTANGRSALSNNTTGFQNIATGHTALVNNTTGSNNTAHGYQALAGNFTGNNNTAMGSNAGTSIIGSGNVCIGQGGSGEGGVDDRPYIRNVNTLLQNFSAGVSDYVTVRLSDGRLGHTAVVSSQRYKQDIKPLAAASQALYALKPVSFRLKKEFDPTQALGFGLIAEEVEKVDSALVYRNVKGQVESVRYEMVNAMLLNEFLKEHQKVQEQEAMIARLKRDLRRVKAQVQTISPMLRVAAENP